MSIKPIWLEVLLMLPTVHITYGNVNNSVRLEKKIREKLTKLNRLQTPIQSCHLILERPLKDKRQGKLYNLRVIVKIKGKEIAVTKQAGSNLYVAIHQTFEALLRQVESHVDKRHGQVKSHSKKSFMVGKIKSINAEEGYGFILGNDNNEYYFDIQRAIHPHFSQLKVTDKVQFVPEVLSDGWQANEVKKA
jgi:ribosomal subunit interface protein